MHRIRDLKDIPNDALLVTTDYILASMSSINHEAGLQALKEVLEGRKDKKISTNDLEKMVSFVLKNNYFEFCGEVKHQITEIAIGTKFAPTYASIFIDEIETNFLDTQEFKPYDFDISMFSLFGHMVKKKILKSS